MTYGITYISEIGPHHEGECPEILRMPADLLRGPCAELKSMRMLSVAPWHEKGTVVKFSKIKEKKDER